MDSASAQISDLSALALRSCYCTAFCRFVTGLLDSMQESQYKVSMYDKARELHLPSSFVELRHEAIHGELPSLVVLRQAVQKALDWLWKNYWQHLDDEGNVADFELSSSSDRRATLRRNFKDILQKYSEKCCRFAQPTRSRDIENEAQVTYDSIVELLSDYSGGKKASAEFINILMDQWMVSSRNKDYTVAVLISYWDPLLNLLALQRPYFLRMLSDSLVEPLTAASTSSSNDTFHLLLLKWLARICTASDWLSAYDKSSLDDLNIVSKCLQSPNRWTLRLASEISECPKHGQVKKVFGHRIAQAIKGLEDT
ncbi:MAG: hypothetical protein Q9166_004128 [cf. Caloplaca sp. 2 TL-2023]